MLENLQITRAIVHEVVSAAQYASKGTPPSQQILVPTGETMRLICERLAEATGSASHCVDVHVERAEAGQAFQRMASLLAADDQEFIAQTAKLASMLSQAQTVGAVKAGVGVFLQGTGELENETVPWTAVIKADPDRGLIKRATARGITLEFVSDLILGAHQRLLKVAFMVEEQAYSGDPGEPRDPDDFSIRVYDHLMSTTGRNEGARYFYSGFLGCKIAATAPKETRQFFERTKEFIDATFTDPADKVAFRGHLVSYLRSQRGQIGSREFADDYLPQVHRSAYKRMMRESGFPTHAVSKDTSLIERRLKKSSLRFSSKLMIVGPADVLANSVKIGDSVQQGGVEWTQLLIKGTVESMR